MTIVQFGSSPINLREAVIRQTRSSNLLAKFNLFKMPKWWNGRHASLRNWCRETCGFDSLLGHQLKICSNAAKVDGLADMLGV